MIFYISSFSNFNFFSFNTIEIVGFILILAIAIDLIFGEFPVKIHPVVIIGKFTDYFIEIFIKIKNKLSGLCLTIAVAFLSFSLAILIFVISTVDFLIFTTFSTLLLSSMFSFRLLLSSANDIKNDLLYDLNKARKSMSFLVSRKTDKLSKNLIISAVIETLTENITDSCTSVFFYYLASAVFTLICILIFNNLLISCLINFFNFNNNIINFINIIHIYINNNLFYIIVTFSVLSTIFFRIVNTLDAMVGYKNEKYLMIGFFPAKLDDLLNFFPSRFSAIMIVIAAFLLKLDWRNSYFILKRDSYNCSSPNSGFTMAPSAGALNIQLKKEGVYTIGDENQELASHHIEQAIKLSKLSIFLSLITLLGMFYLSLFLIFYLHLII